MRTRASACLHPPLLPWPACPVGHSEAGTTPPVPASLTSCSASRPPSQPLHLVGDGHPAYNRAVGPLGARVDLRRFPNPRRGPKGTPRSTEMIERDRAMFPVDALHALLRPGLTGEPWTWRRVLACRLVPAREPLPPVWGAL